MSRAERVIHTKTQEQFNKVLEVFEKKGWTWIKYYEDRGFTILSYEEFLKEEGIVDIKPGELVGVDDNSQENADEDFRLGPASYYIGKTRKGLYVTENEQGYIYEWKYISNKLIKEKEKVEISLEEIANKFGIDKSRLLIKE